MKINKSYDIQNRYMEYLKNRSYEKGKQNTKNREKKDVDITISKSAKKLVEKINEPKNSKYSKKVEEIKRAIIEGQYGISTGKIADKILENIEEQKRQW